MAHRFKNVDIPKVTLRNYADLLPISLVKQVEVFLPPHGSFDNACLRRYLENVKNY